MPQQRQQLLAVVGLVAIAFAGCSKSVLHGVVIANQRPTVELTQVPVPNDTTGTYVYEISWAGFDPDGRIARFQYAVDPPGDAAAETSWVSTTANRLTFRFRADSATAGDDFRLHAAHTVAVVAWDNAGARSAVAFVSFIAHTVAPTVAILSPSPSPLLAREVAPSVRLEWQGDDPDGVGTRQPASFRWTLLSDNSEFPRDLARIHPDSLRLRYAPTFATWDSLPGSATAIELHDLVPNRSYTFVIVAIDQAGAYSPVFNLSTNMLDFSIKAAGTLGPVLTISSPVFTFTFPSGGFFVDPQTFIHADFAAGQPIPLSWSARPTSGSFIRGYRWALDIGSIDDETPRTDEDTDLRHWSRMTTATSVVLPAINPPSSEEHLFYLEAVDDLGERSLGVVRALVVHPTFAKDLLVVNDTWFNPDRAGTGGCVGPPSGPWPDAAELDTFLFAAGDKPWRCYPAGTRSTPGVFLGYSVDTISTHLKPPGTLSLQLLDLYQNIIWMTDFNSAVTYDNSVYSGRQPMPLLRDWCTPGNQDRLETWLLQGGHLWLQGGGAAIASLKPYDVPRSPNNVFSSALGELAQGRLMYDGPHWRSEVTIQTTLSVRRSSRAIADSPDAPDYSVLPDVLLDRNTAGDPPPPNRSGAIYPGSCGAEFLSKPNSIIELDPPRDPVSGVSYAALDTLYETGGGSAGVGNPVMTYYHGKETGSVVFSGFPIWFFQRDGCIQLVDFVLQRIWGLKRQPIAR